MNPRLSSQSGYKLAGVEMDASLTSDVVCVRIGVV
jgi:hypothetical protein